MVLLEIFEKNMKVDTDDFFKTMVTAEKRVLVPLYKIQY